MDQDTKVKAKKPCRTPVVTYVEPVKFLRRYRTRLEVLQRVMAESMWRNADISTEVNIVVLKKGTSEMRIKFPSATEARRAALTCGAVVTASRGARAAVAPDDVPVPEAMIRPALTKDDALEREFSARWEEQGTPDESGPEVRGEGEYPDYE